MPLGILVTIQVDSIVCVWNHDSDRIIFSDWLKIKHGFFDSTLHLMVQQYL